MSAVPEDLMREPAERRKFMRPDDLSQQAEYQESRAGWWQWLAIGVLLVCWLAEATLYATQGL
jgi:hypothetical protein